MLLPIVMLILAVALIVFDVLVNANLVYHVTQEGWVYIGNEDVAALIWETKKIEGGFSMIPS